MTILEADEVILNKIERIICNLQTEMIKVGELLAKLSRVGIQAAKKRFCPLPFTKDHIDRLVAHARGQFPEHLALRTRSIRLDDYFRLRESTREILNDPLAQVPVVTPQGVKTKLIKDLTFEQLHLVFDPRFNGYVSVDDQQKKLYVSSKDILAASMDEQNEILKAGKVCQFSVKTIPGTRWLVIAIDGKRYKVSSSQFRKEAKKFQ